MIADDIAMIHLRQARGLAGSDTFAELLKHNQMAMRINGQAAFDDEFLRAAAKLYGSTSPAGQGFLARGGQSPRYASKHLPPTRLRQISLRALIVTDLLPLSAGT